jgi:nitrite reductase/ring-hydroxylating ferredoxin subunit
MTPRAPFDQTEPPHHPGALTPALTDSRLPDRRGVLAAAVGVVGAGALAACSSPPIAAETSSSSSDAPTSDIPVGGGKVYPDQEVVVTQPTAGQYKAFSAICTHQGCTVGQIEGGQIICPCHASHFSISTGAPTSDSLAQSPLAARTITVTGDRFTVS